MADGRNVSGSGWEIIIDYPEAVGLLERLPFRIRPLGLYTISSDIDQQWFSIESFNKKRRVCEQVDEGILVLWISIQ